MKKITEVLVDNYRNFPFDTESEQPLNAITTILDNNASFFNTVDPREIKDQQLIFSRLIAELDCFTYRAVKFDTHNSDPVYWNSLEESFTDFCSSNPERSTIYQNNQSYPTKDMILAWCRKKVSQ